jgi:hypothetical protein
MDLSSLVGMAKAVPSVTASLLPGQELGEDDIQWGDTGVIDHVLQGRTIEGSETTSIRALTDAHRKQGALTLPVVAGTRVSFVANLGSVLAYDDIPEDKMAGTVVTVRSATGDVTAFQDRVHVLWDDGQFRAIQAEHLRLTKSSNKQAAKVQMRVSNVGDFAGFFEPAFGKTASDSDLIHKATKDLWSFRQEGGEYVIERLFKGDGTPLKV